VKYFEKFVFLSDVSKVSRLLTDEEDKKAFRALHRNKIQDWSGMGERQRLRICKVIKENAVDLYSIFEEHGCEQDITWV
jgi:hypothetical protein